MINHSTLNQAMTNLCNVLHSSLNCINNECFLYNSKLHLSNIFYFLCTKVSNNFSNLMALQQLKNKNIVEVSESGMSKKRDKVDFNYFRILFEMLYAFVKTEIDKLSVKIPHDKLYATDGTTINFCNCLINAKFNPDDNNNYQKALVNTIFDISRNIPINVLITKNMSEPQALIQQLNSMPNDGILLADGHYLCNDTLKEFVNRKLNFIVIISKNVSVVKEFTKSYDKTQIVIYNNCKIRLIKTKVNNSVKIIGTNIIDWSTYPDKLILEIYNLRWFIEEFYKTMKCTLNMNKNNSLKINNILQ